MVEEKIKVWRKRQEARNRDRHIRRETSGTRSKVEGNIVNETGNAGGVKQRRK